MVRVGEAAWLLELGGSAQVLLANDRLRAHALPAVREIVPGASTLLVVLEPGTPLAPTILRDVERDARAAAPDAAPVVPGRVHRIPVVYDGDDLREMAERAGYTVAEVIERHAAGRYRVAFVGFQPGFAYLSGLPPELHLPRRPAPRARIPAGSVAIGGAWTGIYPFATPGGWNLLGHTDVVTFDPTAEPPALLQPGDAVRFEPR